MKLFKLAIIPALSAGVLLGACTSAEVVSNIENACAAIGSGLSAVALISGNISGATLVSSTISAVINDVSSDCASFATDVGSAVADITNIGGTASVTVSSAPASAPAASKRFRAKFGGSSVHFIVTPQGNITRIN